MISGCPYNWPPYNSPPYSSPPYNLSLFNSPPWQLATLTTRHSDNSPPYNSPLWQLVTMAYMPGSFSLFWLFFYFNVCTVYCSPDFSFNILQIFGSDQWDPLSHNFFVIFFIRLYRCLLQIFLVPNFVLLSLLITYCNPPFITPFWLCNI
jgi:hypothetical protein